MSRFTDATESLKSTIHEIGKKNSPFQSNGSKIQQHIPLIQRMLYKLYGILFIIFMSQPKHFLLIYIYLDIWRILSVGLSI